MRDAASNHQNKLTVLIGILNQFNHRICVKLQLNVIRMKINYEN